jgi:hypothetical protein
VTEGNYDIGANPSEEEAEESVDSSAVTVNNLVAAMRLEQTQFDKKSYMAYIKGYMKNILGKLKETNPERADAFQKAIQPFIKKVLDNFDDFSFYTGASMDPEGMIPLQFYKEDGITPYTFSSSKPSLKK